MAPTCREGVPKAALSTNCPREPAGQPHGYGVPWAFQQTLQASGKLRVPGALLDGFPILPPPTPVHCPWSLALGQDGGGPWVQVSTGW